MKNDMSTVDILAGNNKRLDKKKRHIGLIILGVIVVIAIVAVIVTAYSVKKNNELLLVKNLISQFEINTTYRESELDAEQDDDGDGVLNGQEDRDGTNPLAEDSDNDGLSDGDEASLGTDPTNEDTDGDGLLDGYELIVGLDPKTSSTDGETNDADVKVSYTTSYEKVTLDVSGNANIADVSISEMNIFGISSNTGIVSDAYDFTSDYDFDSATITFEVSESEASGRDFEYSELSVLKFDSDAQEYEKMETKTDSSAGTVSADITSYGTYVVGVEDTANEDAVTRIAFLLDNSGSMYPVEQCEVSPENDVNFKRLDFTKSLIDKIEGDGDYLYSISKFTGEYTNLQDFTDDTEKLYAAINAIRTEGEVFDGSHIETAVERCIESFDNTSSENTRNIIVLLSDGASDEDNAKSIEELAQLANEKNIIVMTVGLGKQADRTWLQELSSKAGGRYYSASDADALDSVYERIVTTLNYDIVEYSDSDEEATGYSIYNTGFDPSKNGLSVKNFRTSTTPSVDFGIALLARDWYVGRLSMTMDAFSPTDDSEQKYDTTGYDLSGTDIETKFDENEPLSNVVLTMMNSDYADVKQYLDFSSKGSVLKVLDDLIEDAESCGWVSSRYKLSSSNLQWEKVELLSLDIAGGQDKIEQASSKSELEFYKALYSLNAVQWNDSGAEFDLFDGDEGFDYLKNLLAVGEPVLTTIDGAHTVNAISLIQDSEDHRRYILEVYDSNYPGAVKKLYITRAVMGEFDISDGEATLKDVTYQYTCEYEGKQVGVTFSDIAV